MASNEENSAMRRESTVRDVAGVIFRRFWLAGGFAFVVLVLALGAMAVLKKVYRSDAKVLVRIGRESVSLDPTATTGQVVSLALTRLQEINSEIEILTGRRLAARVVDAMGPEAFLSPGGRLEGWLARTFGGADGGDDDRAARRRLLAIDQLQEHLEVRAVKDSNVIGIAYEAGDARQAQLVLDRLLRTYLEEHISAHRTPGSRDFFERQAAVLRQDLAGTEAALRDLKDSSGIVSLDGQREALAARLAELAAQGTRNQTAVATSRARVEVLERQFAAQPEMVLAQVNTGVAGSAAELMRQRLYELQIEEQSLLARYLPESQPVRRIRQQIEESRKVLEAEEARHRELRRESNQVRRDLELKILGERDNLASLEAEGQFLERKLADVAAEIRDFNEAAMRIRQLERRQAFQQSTLQSYTDKMEQARIDEQLEAGRISNISVVQPAMLPDKPVRPKKSIILVLALLLGLSGGVATAFVVDGLDRSFHNPQDVEKLLRLPVLASVPRTGTPVVLLDPPATLEGQHVVGAEGAPCAPIDARAGLAPGAMASSPESFADGAPEDDGQAAGEGEAVAQDVLVAEAPANPEPRSRGPEIPALPVSGGGVFAGMPPRRVPDAYDELRDELLILRGWSLPAAFGVLGISGGEGASTVATNLAVKLAGSGDGPGLLVDCNLERPAVHEMFDLPLSPGLGELEGGRITNVPMLSSPVPHLDVLSAGRSGRFLPMTHRLQALGVLLAEWKKRYRFVVLDLPPVCAAGSALRMAALLDGVVLIVEAGHSRHDSVERARQMLEKAEVRTVGVVLNKRRFPVPRWLYDRL